MATKPDKKQRKVVVPLETQLVEKQSPPSVVLYEDPKRGIKITKKNLKELRKMGKFAKWEDKQIINYIKLHPEILKKEESASIQEVTIGDSNYGFHPLTAKQKLIHEEFGDLTQINNFNQSWLKIPDDYSYSMWVTKLVTVRLALLDAFILYYLLNAKRHDNFNWATGYERGSNRQYAFFDQYFVGDNFRFYNYRNLVANANNELTFFLPYLCICNLREITNDLLIFAKVSLQDVYRIMNTYITSHGDLNHTFINKVVGIDTNSLHGQNISLHQIFERMTLNHNGSRFSMHFSHDFNAQIHKDLCSLGHINMNSNTNQLFFSPLKNNNSVLKPLIHKYLGEMEDDDSIAYDLYEKESKKLESQLFDMSGVILTNKQFQKKFKQFLLPLTNDEDITNDLFACAQDEVIKCLEFKLTGKLQEHYSFPMIPFHNDTNFAEFDNLDYKNLKRKEIRDSNDETRLARYISLNAVCDGKLYRIQEEQFSYNADLMNRLLQYMMEDLLKNAHHVRHHFKGGDENNLHTLCIFTDQNLPENQKHRGGGRRTRKNKR
jgi:hypothetical protein